MSHSVIGKRLSLLMLIIIFLLFPSITKADGLFIPHEQEDITQPSQKAIILFDNKTEQLIIQSKYEGNITDFGWIIPLPSYPKVETVSGQLFIALHEITYPENYDDKNKLFNLENETEKTEVLERIPIGPYDVSILSTKDSNSLLEWLSDNNYNFPDTENAREILEYYVNKNWNFVAMRVDVIRIKKEIINKYRTIDERILSLDDIVKYLSEDSLENIKEKKTYDESVFKKLNIDSFIYNNQLEKYWEDYDIHPNIHDFVINEISGYRSQEEVLTIYKNLGYNASNITQLKELLVDTIYKDLKNNQSYDNSKFRAIILKGNDIEKKLEYNKLQNKYTVYLNRDYTIKDKLSKDISNRVNPEIYATEMKLKSGTIEPVKMTFSTDKIIYPLKISSLGGREMEILIYTLTDYKTQAENFSLEYANWIYPNITNTASLTSSFWSLGTIITKKYYLTKLRANLTVDQMANDVIIFSAGDNFPYRMEIEKHPVDILQDSAKKFLQFFAKIIQKIKGLFHIYIFFIYLK